MTVPTLARSIPDALSVPGLETKASKPGGGGVVTLDDDTGVVEALVSVTGVVDEVGDIILPGAYKATLTKRTPKGVFSHDWGRWVARTEKVEEWLPGDPRLPTKTREGDAWPTDAGALFVRMRFNVKTREGLDAYENVKFFSETGECEWSIGYHVPPGSATKDSEGIRRIKALDLFEYSPVLFGAAPLSGTLAVKSRLAAADHASDADAVEDAFVAAMHEEGLANLDWAAVEAAAAALDSGEWPVEGKAGVPGVQDTPSDVANTRRLIHWYERGGGAAQINWGTDGDFMRCVAIAGKHMTPERAKGFCANRHKGSTGAWPGHAAGEGHKWLADDLLTRWSPEAEVGQYAGAQPLDDGGLEAKEYPHLAGSLEEAESALRRAVNDALRGDPIDGTDDGQVPSGGDRRQWDYVEIVATQPDDDDWRSGTVIARRNCWEGSASPYAGQTETYALTYTVGRDGTVLDLGDPEPVWIEVTAEVMTAGVRADDGLDPTDADGDMPFLWGMPIKSIDAATEAIRIGASMRAPEVKAGRVLSSSNVGRLKGAVMNLLAVLKAAGVDLMADGVDGGGDAGATTGGGATEPDAANAQTKSLDPAAVITGYRAFAEARLRD